MKKTLRNKDLPPLLFEKARITSDRNPNHMVLRIYSYRRGEMVDVISFFELNDLVEERRRLGLDEDLLDAFKRQNTVRLIAWLAERHD